MAYTNPLDPTTPTDADWAHQGDDEFRKLKAALIERFGTAFINFPDGDPLLLKQVQTGAYANRPAPQKNWLYFAYDTGQIFAANADGSQWVLMAGGGGAGGGGAVATLAAPTGFTLTNTSTCPDGVTPAYGARLQWTNAVADASIEVTKNGAVVATLGAGTALWDDPSAGGGTHTYGIRHVKGTAFSSTNTKSLEIPNPCTGGTALAKPANFIVEDQSQCLAGLSASFGQRLAWQAGDATAHTLVFRNGINVARLEPGVAELLENQKAGTYTWEVQHEKGSLLSDRSRQTLTVQDPCAISGTGGNLGVDLKNTSRCSTPVTYEVEIRWFQELLATRVNIWRNGVQISNFNPIASQPFVDGLAAPGSYTYEVQAVDENGNEISRGTANITLNDPCKVVEINLLSDDSSCFGGTPIYAVTAHFDKGPPGQIVELLRGTSKVAEADEAQGYVQESTFWQNNPTLGAGTHTYYLRRAGGVLSQAKQITLFNRCTGVGGTAAAPPQKASAASFNGTDISVNAEYGMDAPTRIERSKNGAGWELATTILAGAALEYIQTAPGAGTYKYRLRHEPAAGPTAWVETNSVTLA